MGFFEFIFDCIAFVLKLVVFFVLFVVLAVAALLVYDSTGWVGFKVIGVFVVLFFLSFLTSLSPSQNYDEMMDRLGK